MVGLRSPDHPLATSPDSSGCYWWDAAPGEEKLKFFLGTHEAHWLSSVDVPLFVSTRRLSRYKTLPPACGPWAQDSGGFTELSMYGEWRTRPSAYIAATRRNRDEVGLMEFAAPQDWMCEPFILEKTKSTVLSHQRRTCRSIMGLRESAPDIPWIPVLQGWTLDDYRRHVDMYSLYRMDLTKEPLVGLGSVCRRQSTREIAAIVITLARMGIRLHGFGFKVGGVKAVGKYLASCDSLAWSFQARKLGRRWCANGTHKKCANCKEYALDWRRRLLAGSPVLDMQGSLYPDIEEDNLLSGLQSYIQPTVEAQKANTIARFSW